MGRPSGEEYYITKGLPDNTIREIGYNEHREDIKSTASSEKGKEKTDSFFRRLGEKDVPSLNVQLKSTNKIVDKVNRWREPNLRDGSSLRQPSEPKGLSLLVPD
ncbi:unnamed protein product [Victoria cruziana]